MDPTRWNATRSERSLPDRAILPILEAGVIQIARGATVFEMTRLIGHELVVTPGRVQRELAGYPVPDPDWRALFVPLRWLPGLSFDGVPAEPGDALLSTGPCGYATKGSDRDILTIRARKTSLLDVRAALSDRPVDGLSIQDADLRAGLWSGRALKRIFLRSAMRPAGFEQSPGCLALSESRERILVSALSRTLLPHPDRGTEPRPANVIALRVVRLAEATVPTRPLSLVELCRAAGVSNAWPHRCFNEIRGMPPAQCMSRWRLKAAGDALLDRGLGAHLVMQVRLEFGVGNSGRSAQ